MLEQQTPQHQLTQQQQPAVGYNGGLTHLYGLPHHPHHQVMGLQGLQAGTVCSFTLSHAIAQSSLVIV